MISRSLAPGRLDQLLLARGPTASAAELARALRPFAPPTWDDARWTAAIAGSLERVRGAADRPFGGAPWKRVAQRIVPGLALGIAADDARSHKKLADARAWAGAIVARAEGLWREGPPPSWSAVCDALVWRALGLAGKPKRTPPEIRAHFVAQALGAGSGPPDRVLRMLAARAVGASRGDLAALREALVRRWLAGETWAPGEDAPPLSVFADAVRDAVVHSDAGFGSRKVFIASVWRTLRAHPALGRLSLDEFKRELVEAHRAGLVTLARADLVGAMDPEIVRESETTHLEARYHFVEKEAS